MGRYPLHRFTNIFTVPLLVFHDDLHVAKRTEDIGFYAGFVGASFMFGRFLTSTIWGIAADRIGRKPVILFSVFSVVVFNTLFGLSVTYWMAIATRFLLGALNGLLGPIKAYLTYKGKFEAQGPNKSSLFRTSSVTKRYSHCLTYRSRYATTGCTLSRLERGRSDHRTLLNPAAAAAWTRGCCHRRQRLEWVGDCFPSTSSPSASPQRQLQLQWIQIVGKKRMRMAQVAGNKCCVHLTLYIWHRAECCRSSRY